MDKMMNPATMRAPSHGQMRLKRYNTAKSECFANSGMTLKKYGEMAPRDSVSFSSKMHMCAETKVKIGDVKHENTIRSSDQGKLQRAYQALMQ